MKKQCLALLAVSALLLCGTASAQAGFLDFQCTFPDDPGSTHHLWDFDYPTCSLTLQESIGHLDDDHVQMWGETEGRGISFHVTKTVQNTTIFDWIGYTIDIIPGSTPASFLLPPAATPASSPYLQWDSVLSSTTHLEFVQPVAVPTGGSVTFDFDIYLDAFGVFDFTIRQQAVPIPEPATLSLLGFGLVVLLRRR